MTDRRTRLAVLGSPISHSLSPTLHRAAYSVLGRPWSYEAIELTGDGLSSFVRSLDDGWRGLSLTMPLKRDILPFLDRRDPVVDLTGSANTVSLTDGTLAGFNTDVSGLVEALRSAPAPRVVQVLGAGATAASAVVAVAELGASAVHVSARSAGRAAALVDLGEAVGVEMTVGGFGEQAPSMPDLVICTLPGGTDPGGIFADAVMHASTLLDIAYAPWPSAIASRWSTAGGVVISGIEMLVNQAIAQVRVFVGGDPGRRLVDEPEVRSAMRQAVGLAPSAD